MYFAASISWGGQNITDSRLAVPFSNAPNATRSVEVCCSIALFKGAHAMRLRPMFTVLTSVGVLLTVAAGSASGVRLGKPSP
jgi:hypothetical protein